MKRLRNLIIIVGILIVLTLIAIIVLQNNNVEKIRVDNSATGNIIQEEVIDGTEPLNEQELARIPYNEDIEPLTDALYYFVVKSCMQNYLDTINIESSAYYGYDDNGNYINLLSEEERKENIIKLLNSEYIQKNNINVNNIDNYISILNEKVIFVSIEIKKVSNSDSVKSFVVHGLLEKPSDYSLIDNIYARVDVDDTNLTYSIEPLNNLNNINIKKIENNIPVNERNTYRYQTIKDEDLSKEYILSYKRLAIGAPEILYEKLNKDYRNKRFGNVEAFKQYIEESKDIIYRTTLSTYLVEEKDGFKQYVLRDQNEKKYIFQEVSPMQYTIMLDTYTIDLPEFLEKYNEADEDLKVKMNIDRFFEALLEKDYDFAYSKLDENFKSQYFSDILDFEEYAKKIFIYDEEIRYKAFSELDENYTYILELENGESIFEKTFTVKLLEGTDFRLSFDIN